MCEEYNKSNLLRYKSIQKTCPCRRGSLVIECWNRQTKRNTPSSYVLLNPINTVC